jgi:hypothetical protein
MVGNVLPERLFALFKRRKFSLCKQAGLLPENSPEGHGSLSCLVDFCSSCGPGRVCVARTLAFVVGLFVSSRDGRQKT